MPAFMKLDGIDGESTDAQAADSFDFKAPEEPDAILIALLLPAVQQAPEAEEAFFVRCDRETTTQADTVPIEEVALGYTEVEWTY